jgi:membrane protein
MGQAVSLIKETVSEWSSDRASRLAAALAFYTTFSIAPLLVIVIALTSAIFGEEAARGQIERELGSLVGEEAAAFVQGMVARGAQEDSRGFASVLGILALLFGATGAFAELRGALNTVWNVEPKSRNFLAGLFESRLLSFAMVLGVGFLLLVSLVLSAALAALTEFVGRYAGSGEALLFQAAGFVTSFLVVTALFAMIFKFLPDDEIQWKDVWIGASVTALLFSGGKFLIGLYLGRSAVASTYGAAGALAVLLLWVYYSAQILLFGAEFTEVYARRFGSHKLAVDEPDGIGVLQES